ncbi:hypothetical protein N790_01395 [Arenimonas malthae CC-JY-1]|uniref:Uncharacterized protein n=1 Tax=Arenimonas malthae CC-JY-1 TaxID=1384054 RepID=A0A091B9W5_9GAMM|nr:hypothetical protein N790_01395 [Arenimonas malthae CC-JY-1]
MSAHGLSEVIVLIFLVAICVKLPIDSPELDQVHNIRNVPFGLAFPKPRKANSICGMADPMSLFVLVASWVVCRKEVNHEKWAFSLLAIEVIRNCASCFASFHGLGVFCYGGRNLIVAEASLFQSA